MRLFKIFGAIILTVSYCTVFAQNLPLKAFPLSAVRLLPSPFTQAQTTDLNYMMSLNPDRLLAPYLREAGLPVKAPNYGNWENDGLDGHIGGHYLSALALMYASTNEKKVKERLDYMITELQKCQDKNGNGYLGGVPGGKGMWDEIAKGNINASSFALNKKWVPLYNIHKMYAGLYDAYISGRNTTAKNMLIAMCDWMIKLTTNLTDEQIQTMLKSEHGGLNESFANVYAITLDEKYLTLAKRFSHMAILDPLLKDKDALTGIHANTQIPKVIGYERIASLTGDLAWEKASDFFWKNVVDHRTVAIGGNSVREHFHAINDFSSMIESREGPETCNSYNMLKLTKGLFLENPNAYYMNYFERTVYNHILSSQRPQGGFVYFTPMRPAHYRVYSTPQESFWCCVGSGLENQAKYGEMIYAHNRQDLYVNLFIPSRLDWEGKLTLIQETSFPYSETTKLTVKVQKISRFAIYVRYPSWVRDGEMKINVNGQPISVIKKANGYVGIDRQWKSSDVILVTLPMHTTTEFLPDGSNWMAFLHGPIVLAADMGKEHLGSLDAGGSRMGHIANGPLIPLDDAPLIVADTKELGEKVKIQNPSNLTYNLEGIVYQQKYKNLKLVPFYTLQDTRYTVYWPYTTAQKLPEIVAVMKAKEAKKQAIESATIDLVNTGEQQPELDHDFKGEKTTTGLNEERHFRTASGWFSYTLKNPALQAKTLRITYYGTESKKDFDIYVNNQVLVNVKLDGKLGKSFVGIEYQLSEEQKGTSSLQIKFLSAKGSNVANIYEVRLMK